MHRRIVITSLASVTCRGAAGVRASRLYGGIRREKAVKLRGTVAKIELINPHSWIHIDVKNPDGTVTRWMIEGGTPNTLLRRGFTKDSLPAGTEILVDGYQAKDGSNRANGRDLTFPDGKKISLVRLVLRVRLPDAVKP